MEHDNTTEYDEFVEYVCTCIEAAGYGRNVPLRDVIEDLKRRAKGLLPKDVTRGYCFSSANGTTIRLHYTTFGHSLRAFEALIPVLDASIEPEN